MAFDKESFEAGARAATEAMTLYFQNEDEFSFAGMRVENPKRGRGWSWQRIENDELRLFADGAVADALRDEFGRAGGIDQ